MREEVLEQMVKPAQNICSQLHVEWPVNWILVWALAAPHFLNVFVWMSPASWKHFFDARGLRAVDQFAAFSTLLKAGQALALGVWLWASRPAGLCFDAGAVTLPGWLGTLLLVTLGLALSAGVVRALGKDGVFYGSRIGEHPHFHASLAPPEEWPFSVMQHPQHIGPVLVVWAPLVALLPQLPATAWFVASYWSTLYFINWVVEDFF